MDDRGSSINKEVNDENSDVEIDVEADSPLLGRSESKFDYRGRSSSTNKCTNLYGDRVGADEELRYHMPAQAVKQIGTSVHFLLFSIVAFFVGHVFGIFIIGAKLQDYEHYGLWAWPLVFLPIWLGNGVALLCQLASFCLSMPIIGKALGISEAPRDNIEYVLPTMKKVTGWTTCSPLLGVMPTMPMLLLILVFEIYLCLALDESSSFSILKIVSPILVLEGCLLLQYIFIADQGIWAIVNLACFMALTLSVLAKNDGFLGTEVSWWCVFIPLWIWYIFVTLVALNILYQQTKTNCKILLSPLQRCCLIVYTICLYLSFTSAVLWCLKITQGLGTLFPGVSITFGLSVALFGWTFIVISCNHALGIAVHGAEVKRVPDAGWDSDIGREEWALLGNVSVKKNIGGISMCRMRNCAAKRGENKLDKSDKEKV